jgi:hypothetical protein
MLPPSVTAEYANEILLLGARVKALKAENKRLREAVERIYRITPDSECSALLLDINKTARAALAAKEGDVRIDQNDGWVCPSDEYDCAGIEEAAAHLRAEVKDLKARLKAQTADVGYCAGRFPDDGCRDVDCRPCLQRRARNLRRKNWRKP